MSQKAPLKLRIIASLSGGLIGALNPSFFVATPSYIESIQSRFDFNYPSYAAFTVLFYLTLLFIPCTLSTYCVYPWLYKRLKKVIAEGKCRIWKFFYLGSAFGIFASFFTAFFFTLQLVIIGLFDDRGFELGSALIAVTSGTFLLGLMGAIFYLPLIVITGPLFVWGNHHFIKKHYT